MKHIGSFSTTLAAQKMLKIHDKALGYWQDKTSNELCYKLLLGSRKVNIVGLNLISSNPLDVTLDAKDGAQIAIPQEFDEVIKEQRPWNDPNHCLLYAC